jgi:hypothetical protein
MGSSYTQRQQQHTRRFLSSPIFCVFCLCLIYLLDSLCQVIEQFWYLYAQTSLHFKPETFENGSKERKTISHDVEDVMILKCHILLFRIPFHIESSSCCQIMRNKGEREGSDSTVQLDQFRLLSCCRFINFLSAPSSHHYSANKVFSKHIDWRRKVFLFFGWHIRRGKQQRKQ